MRHFRIAIDSYPLLNWARIIRKIFPANHPLNIFLSSNRRKITIEDALYIGSLLKGFEETQTGFKTFIYKVCGGRLNESMVNLDFFDRYMRIPCDTPMKNLLAELFIGLYGYEVASTVYEEIISS